MAVAGSIIAASALIGVTSSSAAAGGSDVITTVAGGGGTPGIGSGVASLSASLGSPLSGVFDAHGNVVFADQNNNVIRVSGRLDRHVLGPRHDRRPHLHHRGQRHRRGPG